MNYLAHLLLAGSHPESIIGNLAGDFVKGPLDAGFTPGIRRGIQLHRRIDSYTDRHPIVSQLKPLFSSRRRRYAGVVLDVAFDHYLSRHWKQFSQTELRHFIDNIYGVLSKHAVLLPPALRDVMPHMIRDDWLSSYGTLSGTGVVLDRIARRIRRENPLPGSVDEIADNYDRIESGFLALFPEVINFADETRKALSEAS